MQHRSYIRSLALAAAIAASGPVVFAKVPRTVVKPKQHDPERLAAAEAKRARKNAKRLAVG